MEYTSKFKGSEIDSILESVGNPADSPSSDGSAFGRINQLAVDLEKAGSSDEVMRKIYESYGAVYNSNDGTYTLNEVKLTKDEMFELYINENMTLVSENINCFCDYPSKSRTNIPPKKSKFSEANGCVCKFVAYINDYLEVFKLSRTASFEREGDGWSIKDISYSFQGCKNLRKVIGVLNFFNLTSTNPYATFGKLESLEEIRIILRRGIKIPDSPNLSYATMKFMADKTKNYDTAITVTVHANVFAKLSGTASDDAYTQSGHTKEEWMEIMTTAQGRNVSFAEAV